LKSYFDTSCLVALYVPNEHTAAALRHRARTGRRSILFTPLHRLELRTTVRQCAYGGLIRQADARHVLRHIEEDLDDGTLIHEPLNWTESLQQADAVAERLAWTRPCRSLDLWHVAIALEIQAGSFVTFDKDQSVLAQAAGLLAVIPM
jgi:predicted nucleic acid-binding protein